MRLSMLVALMLVRSCRGLLLFGGARLTAVSRPAEADRLSTPRTASPKRVQPKPAPPAEEEEPPPYWYDPRIHVFGNIGIKGRIHALMAPLATAMIDHTSYSGLDVRRKLLGLLPTDATVLDLCCGTGFSTAPGAHGVDTSNEMLEVARWRRPDATFSFGNAESFGDEQSYDIVTCMFATHEMPEYGRRRVLRNAMRVCRKAVWIADIDPDFTETLRRKPAQGASFLAGEPYVLDYLANMDRDVAACAPLFGLDRSWRVARVFVLQGHVVLWRIERIN